MAYRALILLPSAVGPSAVLCFPTPVFPFVIVSPALIIADPGWFSFLVSPCTVFVMSFLEFGDCGLLGILFVDL